MVFFHNEYAGQLSENDNGYSFWYDSDYLNTENAYSISKTLPKSQIRFESKVLFPFFDGLVPEGWLLDIALDNWKINARDRFGLLLACGKNTIGAVSLVPIEEK